MSGFGRLCTRAPCAHGLGRSVLPCPRRDQDLVPFPFPFLFGQVGKIIGSADYKSMSCHVISYHILMNLSRLYGRARSLGSVLFCGIYLV